MTEAEWEPIDALIRMCMGRYHSRPEYQDWLQDARLRVFERLPRKPAHVALGAFVRLTCRYVIYTHYRLHRNTRELLTLDGQIPEVPVPDTARQAINSVVARQALSVLCPRQRAVMLAYYWRGLSMPEIAAEAGDTANALWGRHDRALRRMRSALTQVPSIRRSRKHHAQ